MSAIVSYKVTVEEVPCFSEPLPTFTLVPLVSRAHTFRIDRFYPSDSQDVMILTL
jgi:hypothetical protein